MPFEPGQIVLVSYPFTDHTCAKLRPALVISSAEFNRGEDFIAVPISSQVNTADPLGYPIAATEDFFPDTRLRCSSTVKWTKPMTISATVVQRKLGFVPKTLLRDIQDKIQGIFS